mgnify:FL=1
MRRLEQLPILKGTTTIVLQTAEQHAEADALYRESRALAKALEASRPYRAAKAERAALLQEMQAAQRPLEESAVRLSVAITIWRQGEDAKIAHEAKEEAPRGQKNSAVARVLAAQDSERAEAGLTPSRDYWHAELDDLGALAAHVVASSDVLYQQATELRKDIRLGRMLVNVSALVGVRRHGDRDLEASPVLNGLAEQFHDLLSVAGVRAVKTTGVVNR